MESKTFQVPNIGCDGCIKTIKNEVSQIPGVEGVDGDTATKIITVKWSNPANWQQIKVKLEEIEYAPAEE